MKTERYELAEFAKQDPKAYDRITEMLGDDRVALVLVHTLGDQQVTTTISKEAIETEGEEAMLDQMRRQAEVVFAQAVREGA